MTLEEGIIHAEDVARMNHEAAKHLTDEHPTQAEKCEACAAEHRQLAEWLKELKAYRENTCGDAISRQAVIDLMRGLTRWCVRSEDGKWKNVGLLYDDVMFGIDRLPSVTPQQRTGQWIEVIDETDSLGNKTWHHECSICGSDKSGWGTHKYCPKCGCKMEVEDAD